MVQQTGKKPPPKAMRWGDAEWAWLAEVAKSVGLSRSEFVRRSAMLAAQATAAGLTPYFVGGPQAQGQNTAINDFSTKTAQRVAGGKAVMEEPNRIRRGADHPAKTRRG